MHIDVVTNAGALTTTHLNNHCVLSFVFPDELWGLLHVPPTVISQHANNIVCARSRAACRGHFARFHGRTYPHSSPLTEGDHCEHNLSSYPGTSTDMRCFNFQTPSLKLLYWRTILLCCYESVHGHFHNTHLFAKKEIHYQTSPPIQSYNRRCNRCISLNRLL